MIACNQYVNPESKADAEGPFADKTAPRILNTLCEDSILCYDLQVNVE